MKIMVVKATIAAAIIIIVLGMMQSANASVFLKIHANLVPTKGFPGPTHWALNNTVVVNSRQNNSITILQNEPSIQMPVVTFTGDAIDYYGNLIITTSKRDDFTFKPIVVHLPVSHVHIDSYNPPRYANVDMNNTNGWATIDGKSFNAVGKMVWTDHTETSTIEIDISE